MKVISLFCFLFSNNLLSQNLKLVYTSEVKQRLSDEVRKSFGTDELGLEQLKANENPPLETYILFLNENESSFIYQDRINNSQNQIFDIRYTPAGKGITYHNLTDSVQMQDFGEIYGKTYFIKDSLKKWNWKITSEKKTISGYEVRKATSEDEDAAYIAWYAPKIPISNGPGEFWDLPGLILETEKSLKEQNYKVKYSIESIEILNKKAKIKKPTKGIQIKESDVEMLYEGGRKTQQEMNAQGVEKD